MGFAAGALGDVVKRREQIRLEEAEARKEARLAAIRAEERKQDFEQRKELTQYELDERAKMAAEELKGRKELTQMELASREKLLAAELAARAKQNSEDNAVRLQTARISASTQKSGNLPSTSEEALFVDSKGNVYTKPAGTTTTDFVRSVQKNRNVNILPYSPTMGNTLMRSAQKDQGMLPPVAAGAAPAKKADLGYTLDKNGNPVRSY